MSRGAIWLLAGLIGSISVLACAQENVDTVTLWYRNYDSSHTRQLLELALEQTVNEYGPYKIVRGEEVNQQRALASIMQDKSSSVDVINAVINEERERSLLPVRVVSDRGLIGYRVCIIRRDQQPRFEGVRSHQDLLNNGIVFGQNAHWPDTDILRNNSLPVATSVNFDNLFLMLAANRFHCFLRGVNEVTSDMDSHGTPDLMIEPNLLFIYPSTSTFFTSRKNPALAARIELGLRRALLNGAYEDYFLATHNQLLEQLKLKDRRAIYLNNPLISDEFLRHVVRWRNELGLPQRRD